MTQTALLNRQRFDQFRAAMRWSWKDIDRITGRKNARTNIAKRVPAWSMLAIQAHESYKVLLRQHVVELVGLHLGAAFKLTTLSDGSINFLGVTERQSEVESVLLSFQTGSFSLSSKTSRVKELAEKLRRLYPEQEDVVLNDEGDYELKLSITFTASPYK